MKEFLDFLDNSPTSFSAIENTVSFLKENGYEELKENRPFDIKKGGKYYVTRNGSSIIAFNVGQNLSDASLQICAAHSDCPSLKIKPGSFIYENGYLKLNSEIYGGPLLYPWLDRPLGIAGRVIIKENGKIISKIYDSKEAVCIIPSVAIHMNRTINEKAAFNPQTDLLAMLGQEKMDVNDYLKQSVEGEIISYDLYLYPTQKAYVWGMNKEFISSFHLDNLECAYTTLMGFVNNFNDQNINMYCNFDNEEVGSRTPQGADSDFLSSILRRICDALKLDYYVLLAKGMMLSCDNAHGIHPNAPAKADPVNRPQLNKGVVIKYTASQAYTSDGLSSSTLIDLYKRFDIPYQIFTNRSDSRGGSTLGNISNSHVSLKSVDIGLPQLAMHSPLETCGSKDVEEMIKASKLFYSLHLVDNDLI